MDRSNQGPSLMFDRVRICGGENAKMKSFGWTSCRKTMAVAKKKIEETREKIQINVGATAVIRMSNMTYERFVYLK